MRPTNPPPATNTVPKYNHRLAVWYYILILILAIFIARLFYLQVIRHDYYHAQALADQQKEYIIPAERGIISARSGNSTVPLVFNEKLYTLFSDPAYIKDVSSTAKKNSSVNGANPADYQ